ncbi:MAG: S1C family serine protease [Bacteroidia bacterium]
MERKQIAWLLGGMGVLLIASAFTGAWLQQHFFAQPRYVQLDPMKVEAQPTRLDEPRVSAALPDFVHAVNEARPAVVHIRARYGSGGGGSGKGFFSNPLHNYFDEDDTPKGEASGSGVIISSSGYIATNNHVIEDASEVLVTLFDNRVYAGRIIGVDYNTDLALVKIDDEDLPHVAFGDSDKLQVGEWVLALGNPMDLTSTVTAGIVSAKGRNINLLAGERNTDAGLTIESFIQTDAAVNRGNSGGALVNTGGKLVGINTAIASRTGSYAGYAFAIPASLVKKVMADLLEFGEVQRGFLGVSIQPMSAELAQRYDIPVLKGAYVGNVRQGSSAFTSGLRAGDVIISVNNIPVNNTSELQEIVSRYRPGDKLRISYYRNDKQIQTYATLKGKLGEETLPPPRLSDNRREPETDDAEEADTKLRLRGGNFRNLSWAERSTYELEGGVRVIEAGPTLAAAGIPDEFVITDIEGREVDSIDDLSRILAGTDGYITIDGYIRPGAKASYSFVWKGK